MGGGTAADPRGGRGEGEAKTEWAGKVKEGKKSRSAERSETASERVGQGTGYFSHFLLSLGPSSAFVAVPALSTSCVTLLLTAPAAPPLPSALDEAFRLRPVTDEVEPPLAADVFCASSRANDSSFCRRESWLCWRWLVSELE